MNAKIDDGGPAFPATCSADGIPLVVSYPKDTVSGMTLRDWFAGQALAVLLAQDPRDNAALDSPNGRKLEDWIAANAYEMADAMIAARKGGGR